MEKSRDLNTALEPEGPLCVKPGVIFPDSHLDIERDPASRAELCLRYQTCVQPELVRSIR